MPDQHPSGILLAMLLLLDSSAPVLSAGDSPRAFDHPDRIRYDGQCLTLDGKDVFVFSGAFHYFRCPKALWRDRFAKIKEAGFNAVETYVAWNWHEPGMPADRNDFSRVDLQDLRDWMRMAHEEFGLYTILRPGPYICAEWAGGGFPRWLLRWKPRSGARDPWLRSDDPVFLDWSRHWFEAVCPVIAAEQITRKPPGQPGVILFQIENEYDYGQGFSDDQRVAHLKALYGAARAGGIEVPVFTCWTRQVRGSKDPDLRHVFDAVNLYPRWDLEDALRHVEAVKKDQPDAPGMVPELQGGWFSNVGGQLSEDQDGLTPAQTTGVTLMSILGGATILNYYMLFGGTNFGDWAAMNITTTYDYNSPLREPGGVGEKYVAVKALGEMLQEYGPALARSERVGCKAKASSRNLFVGARRDRDGRVFLFCWNKSRTDRDEGTARVRLDTGRELSVAYDLGPFGFKVLCLPNGELDSAKGQWLPKPVLAAERTRDIPPSVRPRVALVKIDPGASDWEPVKAGSTLADSGIHDSRFVLYRSRPILTDEEVRRYATLEMDLYATDTVVLRVNGVMAHPPAGAVESIRIPVRNLLRAGANEIEVLYENRGYANGGPGMEAVGGIRDARLAPPKGSRRGLTDRGISLSWDLAPSLVGVAQAWWNPRQECADWARAALDVTRSVPRKTTDPPSLSRQEQSAPAESGPGPLAEFPATWYRVEFELPSRNPDVWVPWRALIDATGNGFLYLNGEALGRYWEMGPQREYYLPECWLNFGPGKKNILALCLRPTVAGGALRAVEFSPYADYAEKR